MPGTDTAHARVIVASPERTAGDAAAGAAAAARPAARLADVVANAWTWVSTAFPRPGATRAGATATEEPPLAAQFAVEAGPEREVGLGADLTRTGCTIALPYAMPLGAPLRLWLHVPRAPLAVTVSVVANRERRGGWVLHRVNFVEQSDAQRSAVAGALRRVARTTSGDTRTRVGWVQRAWRRRGGNRRAAARRHEVLPIRVHAGRATFLGLTRDTSDRGLAFVAPGRLDPGTCLAADVYSPRGPRRLPLVAVRAEPQYGQDGSLVAWVIGTRVDRAAAMATHDGVGALATRR